MGDTSWNRRYNLGNDYSLDHGYDLGDTSGNGLPSPITTDTEKTVFLCFNFWWAAVSVQRHAKSWYRNANVGCQCLLVSLVSGDGRFMARGKIVTRQRETDFLNEQLKD